MQQFTATNVSILADPDHGEGEFTFQWPERTYGYEELTIDLDGYCSRRMPIHSGLGPPKILALERNRIRLRFSPKLADLLQLDEEIEITFQVTDEQYDQLLRIVDYFGGTATRASEKKC